MDEMKRTWLVQRLKAPMGRDNPFSFGGGLKNGGLSPDAMSMLRGIWSFDYMGAAEFEFGAVPEALQKIGKAASNGLLQAWSFTIPLSEVPKHWRDKTEGEEPTGDATIYVICRKDQTDEVESRIRTWATTEYVRMKEQPMLAQALRPDPEANPIFAHLGWLELDNGFLFFVDRTMWEKTCALFSQET